MEWNAESVLDALNDFERKPEINPLLDEYLQFIAKNGEIVFPWCKLKPLLKKKLEVVLDEFYESCPVETSAPVPNFETFNFDNLKKTILQALEAFTSAPFTIQRICELVTDPRKHYNRTDKYMRGIEKNVYVVSTIEPRIAGQGDNNINNNVIVNGMINDSPPEDSDTLNGHESETSDSVSSSEMNTSSHILLENFANVFPSAARIPAGLLPRPACVSPPRCIPSASNMCINRDLDSNFISTSEDVESHDEIEFDRSVPAVEESADDEAEHKEDPMDISDEENFHDNEVSMNNEETVAEIRMSKQLPEELPESESKDIEESCVDDIECDSNTIDDDSLDVTAPTELPSLNTKINDPQVEIVSQSDDISDNSRKQESFESINEPEIESAKFISSSEELIKPCSPLQDPSSPLQEPDSLQEPCTSLQESCSPLQESCYPLQEPCYPIPASLTELCSPLQEISDNVADNNEMCVSEPAEQNSELESDKSSDCN